MLQYIEDPREWGGERIDGIKHPRNIEQLWSEEELTAIGLRRVADPPPPPPDPMTLGASRLQFRKMLRSGGRVAVFLIYANGATAEIKDYWELSDYFRRSDAEIEALRVALGVSVEQMDGFFTQAAAL